MMTSRKIPRPQTAAPSRSPNQGRTPDSLRASLDQLLAVEVERLHDEEAARNAKLLAEAQAQEELRLEALAQAEAETVALIRAHQAEQQRRAREDRQVRTAEQSVLCRARASMRRRAAESLDRRAARHESFLDTLKRDPQKRKLKATLAAGTFALFALAAAFTLRFGDLQQTIAEQSAALITQTTMTQADAEHEVQRLERLLAQRDIEATLEQSTLKAELASAQEVLQKLDQTQSASVGPERPPAPRKLAANPQTTQAQNTGAAKPSAPVAVAAPVEETCLPYDPMCFSL